MEQWGKEQNCSCKANNPLRTTWNDWAVPAKPFPCACAAYEAS